MVDRIWNYDPLTGRIPAVRFCPSPNADERPANTPIELIVIHGISLPPGEFGGHYIEQFFQNALPCAHHPYFETIAALKVSSHFFIDREGVVTQFVPVTQRAWHAGVSAWQGRPQCNDYSIGIELEGTDDTPYTLPQYRSLIRLCRTLRRAYPILTSDRLAGHNEIAPDRKTDPGSTFEWARVRRALNMRLENEQ